MNEEIKEFLNDKVYVLVYRDNYDRASAVNQQLIDYVKQLQQENQDLKEQLENCYCNRTDCGARIKDSKVYDSLLQKVDNKQKEFIKYLEDEIKRLNENDIYEPLQLMALATNEHILRRYKEIMEIQNEENK